MLEWWNQLTPLNQGFYCAALFFAVLFVWQLIAAFIGLSGEHEADGAAGESDFDADGMEVEHDGALEHHAEGDLIDSTASFRLLSIRSIVTFLMLFTAGGALYLDAKVPLPRAMGYSVLWGLAGMFLIASVFYLMRRMTESGTVDINSCVGGPGTVYLDIQEGKPGEVRVAVSGVVSHLKARAAGSAEIKAGTPVRITRRLDQTTVEVTPTDSEK